MADMTARTAVFRGLNRKPYIANGEMRRMKNLSSDAYPYLTCSRRAEEYSFKASVPAEAGDGYEADVSELPPAAAELEGAIYRLMPQSAKYKAGEFYYAQGGEWKRGIYNKKFIGAVEELPERFRTDLYICTDSENRYKYYTYKTPNYAAEHNGKIIKWLGKTGGGFVRGGYYVYKSESWEEWIPTDQDYNGFNFEEKNLEECSTSRWYGCDRKWIGETNEQFTNGERYMFVRKSQGKWESAGYSYTCAAALPDAANLSDGAQYRYGRGCFDKGRLVQMHGGREHGRSGILLHGAELGGEIHGRFNASGGSGGKPRHGLPLHNRDGRGILHLRKDGGRVEMGKDGAPEHG